MDIAVAIATIAKKALMILLGDKKGRKFLLYVIGIALFIICIPLITLLGLFGWMAGDSGSIMDSNAILSNIPTEQLVQIQTVDTACKTIETTFATAGLPEADQNKGKAIYMGYLVGMESKDGFYDNLTNCFLNTTATEDVYALISKAFMVVVSEEDQSKFDSLYGITPVRVTTETEE